MEKAVLICMPVKGTPAKNVVRDSLVKQCSKCRADVWATKASIIHSGGQMLVCMPCFFLEAMSEPEEEIRIMKPSEGQIREMKGHFREKE